MRLIVSVKRESNVPHTIQIQGNAQASLIYQLCALGAWILTVLEIAVNIIRPPSPLNLTIPGGSLLSNSGQCTKNLNFAELGRKPSYDSHV